MTSSTGLARVDLPIIRAPMGGAHGSALAIAPECPLRPGATRYSCRSAISGSTREAR
jgi:hypothetical protein